MTKFNDAPQQALGFLLSQTSHIEQGVWEVKYPDITYPSLIPVDTSAGEWAKSVTYFSSDKVGAAKWINGRSRDVPMADVNREKHETEIHMAGIGYDYSIEELNHARMVGQNLTSDKAAAARRSYEELVEGVAFEGDSGKGFEGLLNSTAVTRADVVAGASTDTEWSGKTPDEILTDINSGITGMWSATKTIELADTVLLPLTQYASLFTTRLGDTTVNVMEYIRKNNIFTAQTGRDLDIRAMRQLAGAGATATDRMVIYRKDPTVLKMHIPMALRFLAPQQEVFTFIVPGMFRIGGLDIRRPGAVRYFDAI